MDVKSFLREFTRFFQRYNFFLCLSRQLAGFYVGLEIPLVLFTGGRSAERTLEMKMTTMLSPKFLLFPLLTVRRNFCWRSPVSRETKQCEEIGGGGRVGARVGDASSSIRIIGPGVSASPWGALYAKRIAISESKSQEGTE